MTDAELAATDCCGSKRYLMRYQRLEQLTLTERALKRRKVSNSTESKYMDLRFIVPTSNMSERLFSTARFALTSRRRSTIPASFEKQMFLHANSQLWGVEDVNMIVMN